VHEDDERVGVFVFHYQGFDYGVFRYIQFPRRDFRSSMFFIFVEMVGVGNAVLAQEAGCGCFRGVFFNLAHGRIS
jgi:hypothetical protein